MNSLTPTARRRQQLMTQNNNQRTTRQFDNKKRQTLNSNNDKLFVTSDIPTKKKQKPDANNNSNEEMELNNVNISTNVTKSVIQNNSSNYDSFETLCNGEIIPASVRSYNSQYQSHSWNNKENFHDNETNSDDENLKVTADIFFQNNKQDVLGVGHLSILHAYVRDDLFKDIKIISNYHLESNSEIILTCLQKLNYSNERDGNKNAFMNACRTEIRKTMCSRRGYVKRQIGILVEGKKLKYNKL
jgi:hypothetical protein